MTAHYVCVGECKGVAPIPGTRMAETCNKFQNELKECQCEDDQHTAVRGEEKE